MACSRNDGFGSCPVGPGTNLQFFSNKHKPGQPGWQLESLSVNANGLEVVSAGYGGGYVDISDYQGTINLNPSDTQYSLILTLNGPASDYPWQGTGFTLNDSLASTGAFMPNSPSSGDYSGPGNPGNPANFTWVENSPTSYTLTETGNFDSAELTTVQGGGAYVYGLNLNFDGSPDPGAYDVTFNSLSFSPHRSLSRPHLLWLVWA